MFSANVPVGDAVLVNQYVSGHQSTGTLFGRGIASDANGNFVVVWQSAGQDGGGGSIAGYSVYARLFAADGTPRTPEFRVNTYTANEQEGTSVAMDADGDFVVAWESLGQDGDSFGVYAQRFDAAGNRKGGEFRVNTYTRNEQWFPSVAMDDAGDFTIAWRSFQDKNGGDGVYAKRYDAAGNVLPTPYAATGAGNGEFRINTYTKDDQRNPSIAMDSAGNLAVTWLSNAQDGSGWGVYAQRFDAAGRMSGGEFRVNQATAGDQFDPSVGIDAAGNFTVGWFSGPWFGNYPRDIYFRRFAADGTARSGETKVNAAGGNNTSPDVAVDRQTGAFLVGYQGNRGDGTIVGTVRQYDPAGNPDGDPMLTAGFVLEAAWQPAGKFVLAYNTIGADGKSDVYIQRYAPALAAPASLFSAASITGGSNSDLITSSQHVL